MIARRWVAQLALLLVAALWAVAAAGADEGECSAPELEAARGELEVLKQELKMTQSQLRQAVEGSRTDAQAAAQDAEKRWADKAGKLESDVAEAKKATAAAQADAARGEEALRSLKEAASSAGSKSKDAGSLEREVMELKSRMKAMAQAEEGRVKALEGKLRDEQKRHDVEAARLKRMAGGSASAPLLSIAWERAKEHATFAADFGEVFYYGVVLPRSEEAWEQAQPYVARARAAAAPAEKWAAAQVAQLQPQYEQHVERHVVFARAEARTKLAQASQAAKRLAADLELKFQVFRTRAIETLRKQPAVGASAEGVIDSTLYAVAVIVGILLVGPAWRLASALLRFSCYYGCCCCLCCCCGRRKRADAPAAAAAAISQQAANKGRARKQPPAASKKKK